MHMYMIVLCSHKVPNKTIASPTRPCMAGRYQCSTSPRVAVCLYGAVRDVIHTRPTHVQNVRDALGKALGSVDVFIHALLLPELHAPRNGERHVALDPQRVFELGPACRYAAEDQDLVDATAIANASLAAERSFDASSRLNALRSWYSMAQSAAMVRTYERRRHFKYRYVAAVRSDTAVLTPLHPLPPSLTSPTVRSAILLPNYQHWGGLNDRFALGRRSIMLDTYMAQFTLFRRYWRRHGNTEALLCRLLASHVSSQPPGKVTIVLADICVVRVRADGLCVARDLLLKPETTLPACMPKRAVSHEPQSADDAKRNPCGSGVAAAAEQEKRKAASSSRLGKDGGHMSTSRADIVSGGVASAIVAATSGHLLDGWAQNRLLNVECPPLASIEDGAEKGEPGARFSSANSTGSTDASDTAAPAISSVASASHLRQNAISNSGPTWLGATAVHSSDLRRLTPALFALQHAYPRLALAINLFDDGPSDVLLQALDMSRVRVSRHKGMKSLFWKLELSPGRLAARWQEGAGDVQGGGGDPARMISPRPGSRPAPLQLDLIWLFDCDLAVHPSAFPLSQLHAALIGANASALQPAVQGWHLAGSRHPHLHPRTTHISCVVTSAKFLELMTPIFRFDAWAAFHREVLSAVPDQALAASAHGIDLVWCAFLARAFPDRPACLVTPGILATHLNSKSIERFHQTALAVRSCNDTCVFLQSRWPHLYGNFSRHGASNTGECWAVADGGLERRGGFVGVDSSGTVRARFELPSKKRKWQSRMQEHAKSGVYDPTWREQDPLLPFQRSKVARARTVTHSPSLGSRLSRSP